MTGTQSLVAALLFSKQPEFGRQMDSLRKMKVNNISSNNLKRDKNNTCFHGN